MTIMAWAGCLGEAALIWALIILLRLSQKLGDVMKMKPYYRGYYLAIGLVSLALGMRLLAASFWYEPIWPLATWLKEASFYPLVHHIALAAGITIALPIAFRYWGWLLRER